MSNDRSVPILSMIAKPLCIALLCFFASSCGGGEDADALAGKAEREFHEGDFQSAATLWGRAIKARQSTDPGDQEGLASDLDGLGWSLIEQGQGREAADALSQAVKLHEASGATQAAASSMYGLAEALGQSGELKGAVEAAKAALTLRTGLLAPSSLDATRSREQLAELYRSSATYLQDPAVQAEIRQLYNEALRVRRDAGEAGEEMKDLLLQAHSYFTEIGDSAEAQHLKEELAGILARAKERTETRNRGR